MFPAKHSAHALFLGALAIGACVHERRISSARHDGNEPLATCFEACKPDDDACVSKCEREHPTGWQHRVGAKLKPVIEVGAELQASFATTLRPILANDARASGNEALAACYDSCAPAAVACVNTCEKQHSTARDAERRREMLAQVTKIGVEAYKRDRENERAWAASNGASNDPNRSSGSWDRSSSSGASSSGASSSGASSSGASSSGSSSNGASGESSEPTKNIHFGKSCNQCDDGLKLGLACTIPAKAVCGEGELHTGAGFCVARPTDRGGSCSARCTSSRSCPSGYTCSDPGTGASVCMR